MSQRLSQLSKHSSVTFLNEATRWAECLTPDNSAIITWRSNNPGGSPEHFGVVYYGTSPKELSQTAKSHIRLNPTHSYTVFRVYMPDLKPKTTYYYKVDSIEPDGASDGVVSPVKHFTTP